jgi:hypothetical protein
LTGKNAYCAVAAEYYYWNVEVGGSFSIDNRAPGQMFTMESKRQITGGQSATFRTDIEMSHPRQARTENWHFGRGKWGLGREISVSGLISGPGVPVLGVCILNWFYFSSGVNAVD